MKTIDQLKKKNKNWPRTTAQFFGSIVVAFWLLMGVGYAFSESGPFTWESAVITALIIITTVGFVIAWRREKIGGTILIVAGVIHSTFAGIVSGHNHLYAILISRYAIYNNWYVIFN